jgi:hypothetical protein
MAVVQKRRFERVKPSGPLSRSGKVFVDSRSPAIDCVIVDYSAGGACLEVPPRAPLPNRFELFYAGTRKKCRVVWTKGLRLGVSF